MSNYNSQKEMLKAGGEAGMLAGIAAGASSMPAASVTILTVGVGATAAPVVVSLTAVAAVSASAVIGASLGWRAVRAMGNLAGDNSGTAPVTSN